MPKKTIGQKYIAILISCGQEIHILIENYRLSYCRKNNLVKGDMKINQWKEFINSYRACASSSEWKDRIIYLEWERRQCDCPPPKKKTNTDSIVLGTPNLKSGPLSVQFKVADWACKTSGHVDMNILSRQRRECKKKKQPMNQTNA